MSLSNLDLYFLPRKQLIRARGVHPLYLKCCEFFGATLIDRTATIESGIPWKIIDEVTNGYTDLTFGEICRIRSQEIVEGTRGSLKILWSGGIDSTVALIAILKVLQEKGQPNRLTILLSKESIIEYPEFYADVIQDRLQTEHISTCIYDHISATENIITGEHGDQLFGSDKLRVPVITGDAFQPYEKILPFLISRRLGTEKYSNDIIEYLKPQIQKSPVAIRTLYDYMWWMNFSMKWQSVSMRLMYGLERSAADLENNSFHFFKSPLFQKWSISNHNQKIKKEWKSYKYIAKEYIHSFHPNKQYLENKEKEQSLKEVIVRDQTSLSLRKRISSRIKGVLLK